MRKNIIGINNRLIKPLVILLFAIIESFLVTSESNYSVLFAIVSLFMSLVWDKNLAVAIYVCISLLHVELNTLNNLICMGTIALIMGLNMYKVSLGGLRKYLTIIVVFSIDVFFSSFFALESSLASVVFFIFRLFFTLYVAKIVSDDNAGLVFFSIVAVGIAMLAMVWLFPNTLGIYSYRENEKDLATVLGVVIYLIFWGLISKDIKGFISRSTSIFILLLLSATTIFTYARGVLLAVVVSISFIVMISNKKAGVFLIIASVVAFFYFELPSQVDAERMFSNIEGGNGRTTIWLFFYQTMKSQGFIRMLFGCGTSGLTALTLRGTYAHSAILDYFFSFGVLGFFFIVYMLVTISVTLVKAKNWFFTGLMILTVFMYFPHGVHSDFQFLLLLGLCMGATCLSCRDSTIIQP